LARTYGLQNSAKPIPHGPCVALVVWCPPKFGAVKNAEVLAEFARPIPEATRKYDVLNEAPALCRHYRTGVAGCRSHLRSGAAHLCVSETKSWAAIRSLGFVLCCRYEGGCMKKSPHVPSSPLYLKFSSLHEVTPKRLRLAIRLQSNYPSVVAVSRLLIKIVSMFLPSRQEFRHRY
jgi:hypothetical protein